MKTKHFKSLWFLVLLLYIIAAFYSFRSYENKFHIKTVSPEFITLLKDYEGANILDFQTDSDGDRCLAAYDVGDGVATFGYGKTYPTEQAGIKEINKLNNTSYKVGDCIKETHLDVIHQEDIQRRENDILTLDKKYRANINQQQFDAIMLLYYLNEESITDPSFWNMINSFTLNKTEYIDYFINYYSTFNNYDKFKDGWIIRFNDSAQIYFDDEYNRIDPSVEIVYGLQ